MAEVLTMAESRLTSPRAIGYYEALSRQVGSERMVKPSVDNMLQDIAYLEQLKETFELDIEKRGATELFVQGRQKLYRENKSVAGLCRVTEQQRKLLAALKLIQPGGDDEPAQEEADAFEAL